MQRKPSKVVMLSSLGGMLEVYDFTLYALVAPYISQVFFQNPNKITSLLQVFVVFSIGYLVRPLGGIVFGHLADRKGRRYALTLSVLMMALATVLIACTPSTHTWGVAAPITLIVLRVVQGFSMGGEIPSATIFAFEHVSKQYRAFSIGTIFMFITVGNALASFMVFVLGSILSYSTMLVWGWRVPFLFGFLLGIIAFILRRNSLETPVFKSLLENCERARVPITRLWAEQKWSIIQTFLLTALPVATIFLFFYLPTFLNFILKYNLVHSYLVSMTAFLSLAIFGPLFGWISDRVGRQKALCVGAITSIIFSSLLFMGLIWHTLWMPWLFAVCMGSILASVNGVYATAIAESFPAEVRGSGFGFSYNLGFALFGGLSPLFSTYLFRLTHSSFSPYFYLVICAVLTLLSTFRLKDRTNCAQQSV